MERAPKHELKQMHAFTSPAEEALLNLERTTDHLRREIHLLLRTYGLTSTQYSALRILHHGPPGGLPCTDLGNRLVSADPDITRLLDRLAKQKLVRRRRDLRDRRIVLTEITPEGVELLAAIAPMMDTRVRALFQHMAPQNVESMINLLQEARRPHSEGVAGREGVDEIPASSIDASRARAV